uniref:ATP synthase subunit epsilon, mitochondrial n=1 Tax=Steinernema glaseri TaxID=37863 RepID=A0A1I7Y9D5_9BILA
MFWRSAGLNYVRYSKIAAEVTRKCQSAASKKANATLKVSVWEQGKPKKLDEHTNIVVTAKLLARYSS